ncbi:ribosomal RNA small subunit methyltransferase A [Patescibacteria group bacterium]|nr:ribosomal RNA small subunit methyltransferase A [Patescibacteria group bacterium]
MSLYKHTRNLFYTNKFKPLRRRGQNFLINEKIVVKIIKQADITSKDIVLEIGAGTGILTSKIADHAKKVMAVEIDKNLIQILESEIKNYNNIEVISNSILDEKCWEEIIKKQGKQYKIIANLPYNITGFVLKKILLEPIKPEIIIVMLQKEVVERIVANPPKMSFLSVFVQFWADVQIIANVGRNNFYPKPSIDSIIIKLCPYCDKHWQLKSTPVEFFKIVRAGFTSPRKYLLNNLFKYGIISKEQGVDLFKKIKINPKIRAQELAVSKWIELTNICLKKTQLKDS